MKEKPLMPSRSNTSHHYWHLKNKENVYTPKSTVKNEECFVFPEPKTPVNKNQYKREILTTPNHYSTPSKGICCLD